MEVTKKITKTYEDADGNKEVVTTEEVEKVPFYKVPKLIKETVKSAKEELD